MHPHAQRTGGGTIRRFVLAPVFGKAHVYSRMFQEGGKHWRRLTDSDLEGYRAYTDLEDFRPIPLKRPIVGLAALRHPQYRAASLYGLVRGKTDHRHHELAMEVPLEEFYRRAADENPRYFRNLQCRRICHIRDAKLAVETLKEHFIGACLTNDLSAFIPTLGAALGWPDLQIAEVAPDEERYAGAITRSFRDMVLDQNREDLALYETIRNGPPYTPPPRSWNARVNRIAEKTRQTVRRMGRRVS